MPAGRARAANRRREGVPRASSHTAATRRHGGGGAAASPAAARPGGAPQPPALTAEARGHWERARGRAPRCSGGVRPVPGLRPLLESGQGTEPRRAPQSSGSGSKTGAVCGGGSSPRCPGSGRCPCSTCAKRRAPSAPPCQSTGWRVQHRFIEGKRGQGEPQRSHLFRGHVASLCFRGTPGIRVF